MSHITSPVNSNSNLDAPKRTELYDPEDPSLDDDVQVGMETNEMAGDYYSPGDNSSHDACELASTSRRNKEYHHKPSISVQNTNIMSESKAAASIMAERYLGQSMRFLVDLGKELTTNQKSEAIDMFSCGDRVTTDMKVDSQNESSHVIRAFDSRLSSLLDSGLLDAHLNVAPITWKGKHKDQVFPAKVLEGIGSAEEDELVVEDQMRSLLGAPSKYVENQVKRSDSVTSPPPQFLKPRDDDDDEECEPLYSPPRVIRLNRENIQSDQPRPIRLSREKSPAEPVQDDKINDIDSALEPPRIIRLDRNNGSPPVIKLNRERCTVESSDRSRVNGHDTPAEPPRIIRLNRDDSPKEVPRIIQLDRSGKSTSDSSSRKSEHRHLQDSSSRDRSSYKSSANVSDNIAGASNGRKLKSSDRAEDKYLSSKSERKRSRSTSRDRNRDKFSSTEKKKDDVLRECKSHNESSRRTDDSSHDKIDRKRELSKEQPVSEYYESSKRHKGKDKVTPDPDSERHQSRRTKHQHSEEKRTPESSRDRRRDTDKSHRQSEDDRHTTKRYSDDKRSESRHQNSDYNSGKDQSSDRKHSRQKSKDRTSDAHSDRTKKRSDVEQDIGTVKPDHDVTQQSSHSKKHRHSRHQTPDSEHKHRRSSRSHSHKHKSKTRHRKHKRSRSGSRKHRKSRSVSKSVRHSGSRSVSPEKKKHKKKRQLQEHEDRDYISRRHRSKSCSPSKYSEHREKSIEEKDKLIPTHVSYSSHSTVPDEDRKHSVKQTPCKDLDSERTLSLLEVCMKTKYGRDFDTNALRAKHLAKTLSDDNDDIEIVGVTYASDEVMPAANRLSPQKALEDKKKGSRHSDNKDSTCYTIEDEPASPDQVHLQNTTLETVQFESRKITSNVERLKYSKDSDDDQCSDQDENEDLISNTSDNCHETGSTAIHKQLENIDSPKQPPLELHFGANSVASNNFTDNVSVTTVDCTSRTLQTNNPCLGAESSLFSSVPSKFDHIPGICDETFVADDSSNMLAADSSAAPSTRDKIPAAELQPISSPEPESLSNELVDEINNDDVVASVATVVPLERVATPRRPSRTVSSSSETCSSEPVAIEEPTVNVVLPSGNAAYTSQTKVNLVTIGTENLAKSCLANSESPEGVMNSRSTITCTPVFSVTSQSITSYVKCDHIDSSDLQTNQQSPGSSSASYSTGVMSSSRSDSPPKAAGIELATVNTSDTAVANSVSVDVSNNLPVYSTDSTPLRTAVQNMQPSVLVSSIMATRESFVKPFLPMSVADSIPAKKCLPIVSNAVDAHQPITQHLVHIPSVYPAPPQNVSPSLPVVRHIVTRPFIQPVMSVPNVSRVAPQIDKGLPPNVVAVMKSIQPIVPVSCVSSSLPPVQSSLLSTSAVHLPNIQPLATGSSATPALPTFIQSLLTGSSSILPEKTVEELQRLTQLFHPSTAVSSTASVSLPVSSAPKSTVIQAPVLPPISEPTMATRLLASLINLSKSSSASSVPATDHKRASIIDINVDDVASPKSDEMISFSPPPPAQVAVVSQPKPKPMKKDEPKSIPISTSKTAKNNKTTNKSDGVIKIATDFKLILKPYYSSGKINKEEYKEIMRKAVPQIYQSRSGDTSQSRMSRYAEQYVNKVLLMRKYLAKKTHKSGAS